MAENDLKWLVEEREMWKRRAEVAEAELVHRDAANERALSNERRGDRLDIPRDALRLVNVVLPYEQLQYGGEQVLNRFFIEHGRRMLEANCIQALQQPTTAEVGLRSWCIEAPWETRLNYDNVGRFFRLRG